jgi:ATP-dependent helicase HepA
MVVVDEAHHARMHCYGNNETRTQLYELVRTLIDPGHYASRAVLLLTATPMQLDEHELYSLIEMLDPALFPSLEHFIGHRDELPGLNRLVDGLQTRGFPLPDEDADETVGLVAEWLGIDETLARKRLREGVDAVCADLSAQHLLSEVLIRNRKAVVKGFMPRVAARWEVELTPDEELALECVEAYVQDGYATERRMQDNVVGFVMLIFQKLMASSLRALQRSLQRRRDRLAAGTTATINKGEMEARLDDDAVTTDLVHAGNALNGEIAELDDLIDLLDSIPSDSKADVLLANLREVARDDPQVKVLIFTQFRDTQDYLAERLAGEGWGVNTFHGQKHPLEKDRAVDAFRDGTGPQVLISTEAGGEGRNFQFCHVLVNYDLPWNPMRVEQRIGRVDRIGQTDTVQIYNLYSRGTVEERVLDVLEHRIDAFERTIGGLDPILGETERDISRILQRARDERDAAIEALGQDLQRKVADARRAEDQMRDLIMDTKSFSREIAERITGQQSPVSLDDQERFFTGLLAEGRTWIGPGDGGARQLAFHDPLLSDLPDQFVGGSKKLGVFRPDQLRDSEHVEFFAIGHPIIDHLIGRVLEAGYEGVAGTWRLSADQRISPCTGWLIVHEIEVTGLHPYRRLVPVFVNDDGRADVDAGQALVERAAELERQVDDIPFDDLHLDSLDDAEEAARAVVDGVEDEERERAVRNAREQAAREREKLMAWFDYRERAAEDKVAATRATLERLQASDDAGQRRIIPVWESNLERDQSVLSELQHQRDTQFARLDRVRDPSVSTTVVAAGRVEVIKRPTVVRS